MDKPAGWSEESVLRLSDDFIPPTFEEWRKTVESQLKGVPFEKAMLTSTYEGITLQPIYTEANSGAAKLADTLPGFAPYIRGNQALGYTVEPWLIAQEQNETDPAKLNAILLDELMRGLNCVNLLVADTDCPKACGGVFIHHVHDLEKLFHHIDLTAVPIHLHVKGRPNKIASLFQEYCSKQDVDMKKLKGSITSDPFRRYVQQGAPNPLSSGYFTSQAEHLVWMAEHAPLMQALAVSGSPYHHGGANAVQELAFSFASLIQLINGLIDEGVPYEMIASRILMEWSVGSNFFMEIAKFRAARFLWNQINLSYQGSRDMGIFIHARTSQYNKTNFDPYANLLRTTTEAFSAVLGGVDSLHIDPFDTTMRTPDAFSRRIARNQHLILQEESHLTSLIDPAGGSWYVESLTTQLAEKAWALIQEIEAEGGMLASLEKGTPQSRIFETVSLRMKNLQQRKDVIVGTNMFANPGEPLLFDPTMATEKPICGEYEKSIQPILPHRLTELFESLRSAVERYALEKGIRPAVFLANVGSYAVNKPRMDFVQGFLTVAGLRIIDEGAFNDAEQAAKSAIASNAIAVCVCAQDDAYPEVVPVITARVKEARPEMVLMLAGYPTDKVGEYQKEGIQEFIHLRADVLAVLSSLVKLAGVML